MAEYDDILRDDAETEESNKTCTQIEVTKTEEKSVIDKTLDWAKEHKKATMALGIGTIIASVFVGGKIFSKTNTVEVEKLPDPTIMDKYDRIPVKEESITEYAYVLKDEYRDDIE